MATDDRGGAPPLEDLLRELRDLRREVSSLKRENTRLRKENQRLREQLGEAQRAGKRQATPFSKGEPKKNPSRPGRKPGRKYGRQGRRASPPPEEIDERHEAPLPTTCSAAECGGHVVFDRVEQQFQTEIPEPKPIIRAFDVHIGHCEGCGRRVQGRHELQTSDALGAACSQLGSTAIALAAYMNKELGLSYKKVAAHFREALGIEVTASALVQAIQRAARKLEPAYEELKWDVQSNPVVYCDETSARLNGRMQWNWVFLGEDTTVYVQRPSRGFDVIEEVLGAEFDGFVGHDGWAPYDRLVEAIHQQCLGHYVNRCTRLLGTARGRGAQFPTALKKVCKDAMALGRRHQAGKVSPHGLAVATGRLEKRLGQLLAMKLSSKENRKLQKHVANHHEEMFTFLYYPEIRIEPVNWPGEQGIRFAVIFRKNSGGHRSAAGARAQDILMSFFRTAKQRAMDGIEALATLLRSPVPILRPIDPP